VVYIEDKDLDPMTLCLPDSVISIKELIKEILKAELFFEFYGDREVQSGLKLADNAILSECMSTEIEHKGAIIPTYHFTSEFSKGYYVCYLNQPVKGSTTVCRVQLFSSDTVVDHKAAIEEATGIPQQSQALYDSNSKYRIELQDHAPGESLVSFPDPPRKAEGGCSVLSNISCHIGWGRTS